MQADPDVHMPRIPHKIGTQTLPNNELSKFFKLRIGDRVCMFDGWVSSAFDFGCKIVSKCRKCSFRRHCTFISLDCPYALAPDVSILFYELG